MRVLKILILAILLCCVFLACKKNNDVIIPAQSPGKQATAELPKGTWIGQHIKTSRDSAAYFSFNIQDGGSLYVLNEMHEVIGAGSWVLSNSLFNAYYIIYSTQFASTVSGHVHTDPDKIEGNWQFNGNYQDAGTWYMYKAD